MAGEVIFEAERFIRTRLESIGSSLEALHSIPNELKSIGYCSEPLG
jgi:hypothetical protein